MDVDQLIKEIVHNLAERNFEYDDAKGILVFLERNYDKCKDLYDYLQSNKEAQYREIMEEFFRIIDRYPSKNIKWVIDPNEPGTDIVHYAYCPVMNNDSIVKTICLEIILHVDDNQPLDTVLLNAIKNQDYKELCKQCKMRNTHKN